MLVHQLIYQGAADQTAFVSHQTVTYQQLQNQVKFYRNFFFQQGVRPGNNVGLFAKNSVEFVYSYFAIISLGAVVVPLNFQLVAREVAFIVQNAQMETLVTMGRLELANELRNCGYEPELRQLVIPEFVATLQHQDIPEADVEQAKDPNAVCTIVYTSGTTGTPKGAMLTHGNLISNAAAFSQMSGVNGRDHVLCVLPMYHCFAWTCAVLGPLLKGASVTILEAFTRDAIVTIRDAGITVIFGIPTMYKLLATWGTAMDFQRVRLCVSGGSSLPQEIFQQFFRRTGKNIVEGYGLSEASPVVTLNPLDKVKVGSIGKPLPGIAVRIVDADGRIASVGEIGELLVYGPSVMAGYFNLPAETAQTIREGWLHTGDLAYRDDDGYLYVVDRLKDMIITSGENVYPREIEELLYAFSGVAETSVIGIPDKLRGSAVYAYVVMEDGDRLDKKSLREYLQANLALFKVPREVIEVQSLPKNSTGKILKRVLREQVGTL
jgi:long-chain acyl-CoA synthetase